MFLQLAHYQKNFPSVWTMGSCWTMNHWNDINNSQTKWFVKLPLPSLPPSCVPNSFPMRKTCVWEREREKKKIHGAMNVILKQKDKIYTKQTGWQIENTIRDILTSVVETMTKVERRNLWKQKKRYLKIGKEKFTISGKPYIPDY